ncbi:hypothetical protein OH491_27450 (plasmid) [Termitidicoccus mucosus]
MKDCHPLPSHRPPAQRPFWRGVLKTDFKCARGTWLKGTRVFVAKLNASVADLYEQAADGPRYLDTVPSATLEVRRCLS